MSLVFDPASHTYTVDGRVLPSVTEVCNVLAPNYYANVPPDVLERKRAIGVALHAAIALDVNGDLDESSVAPEISLYFKAWRSFAVAVGWKTLVVEKPMHNERYGYAGTPDLIGRMGNDPSTSWLLDVKSACVLSPLTAVQTAAYADMARSATGFSLSRRGALHLRPDGRFEVKQYDDPDDVQAFLAALNVLRWRKNNLKETAS
jgi:hypothetical protein